MKYSKNISNILIITLFLSTMNILGMKWWNKKENKAMQGGYELIRDGEQHGEQRGSPALKWAFYYDINHPNEKQFLVIVEQGKMNQVNAYLASTSFKENISPYLFIAAQKVARDSGHTALDKKFAMLLLKKAK